MNLCKKTIAILSISAAAIFLLLSVVISNYSINVKEYDYSESDSPAVKILFISDLHGRMYGKNNSHLIEKISEQEPDIICLGGDFIDEDNTEEDNTEFLELLKNLIEIAPTYYSYGNHDNGYFKINGSNILSDMESIGCIVFEEEYIDIEINNKRIRLGGMFDYAFNQQYLPNKEWEKDSTYHFLTNFTDTDRTKILMCHRPESFIYDNATALWDIDYILCGHTHGGVLRLPFIGGLIAPEQGLFPEYDKGEYDLNNSKMIISSGLSGYKIIPRLFNSPEITVIEI